MPTLRYNSNLDAWTVVRLTAAKFKPLMFSVSVSQLLTELMTLPPNAISIKSYDFEGSMNSTGHFVPEE
jgi:hypothetical protein